MLGEQSSSDDTCSYGEGYYFEDCCQQTHIVERCIQLLWSLDVSILTRATHGPTVVRARFLAAAFSDGSYLAHVNGAYLRHVTFCIVHRVAYLWTWVAGRCSLNVPWNTCVPYFSRNEMSRLPWTPASPILAVMWDEPIWQRAAAQRCSESLTKFTKLAITWKICIPKIREKNHRFMRMRART